MEGVGVCSEGGGDVWSGVGGGWLPGLRGGVVWCDGDAWCEGGGGLGVWSEGGGGTTYPLRPGTYALCNTHPPV